MNKLVLKIMLITSLVLSFTHNATAQLLTKITFPYSPINSSSLHWMVAKEAKIFDKYGLDVEMVYMGASSLILQSMLSGSAQYGGFGGPAIISNVLKGGDVISVAATTPLTISLMTRSDIAKGEDLQGKKIGISRLGAVPHFAIQLIFDHFNIKNATLLQMGGQGEAAAALRRGSIDGAVLSLPHTFLLEKDGFRELVGPQDYVKLGIQFVSGGIAARRSHAAKNRDTTIKLIKATLEGIKLMATDEAMAHRAFAKFSRQNNPAVLEQVRKFAVATVSRDPSIPKNAMASMTKLMSNLSLVDRASAANTPPEAFFDNSYVDEIKRSGFLKELWQ